MQDMLVNKSLYVEYNYVYLNLAWMSLGANFAAMQSLFEPSPADVALATAVDVVCANVWLAVLFLLIGKKERFDQFMKADSSPVQDLILKVELLEKSQVRTDICQLLCVNDCLCS
jgi:uncharacterized membrane protein